MEVDFPLRLAGSGAGAFSAPVLSNLGFPLFKVSQRFLNPTQVPAEAIEFPGNSSILETSIPQYWYAVKPA